MKKIFYIIFVMLFLVGCSSKKEKNNIEDNKPVDVVTQDIIKEYSVDNVVVRIGKFQYYDGYSTIKLLIYNNNDYSVYIEDYFVNVYDVDNNLIGSFNPIFNDTIEANSETYQMFSILGDYTKANSIKYEFNNLKKVDD